MILQYNIFLLTDFSWFNYKPHLVEFMRDIFYHAWQDKMTGLKWSHYYMDLAVFLMCFSVFSLRQLYLVEAMLPPTCWDVYVSAVGHTFYCYPVNAAPDLCSNYFAVGALAHNKSENLTRRNLTIEAWER